MKFDLKSLMGTSGEMFGEDFFPPARKALEISGRISERRGPAAILFISCGTCSDSIAKPFVLVYFGGIAPFSRDTLQNGVSHRCACVKLSTKGRYRTILGDC